MNKIIQYVLAQLKYFFNNPIWRNWYVLFCIVLSFAIAGTILYLYFVKYSDFLNFTPIAFSAGVFSINLFLAVISYPKEKNLSYILVGVSLFVQLLFLFFIKITLSSAIF